MIELPLTAALVWFGVACTGVVVAYRIGLAHGFEQGIDARRQVDDSTLHQLDLLGERVTIPAGTLVHVSGFPFRTVIETRAVGRESNLALALHSEEL